MAHTHQAKRPYAGSQPSITSYFPSSSPATTSPSFSGPSQTYSIHPSSQNDTRIPILPPTVQSNLLSVGMRVRKSVPEGYKTGSYSAFKLFSDPSTTASSSEYSSQINPTSTLTTMQSQTQGQGQGQVKRGSRPRARELTPFCGILKVGGMAQQQWGIYNPSGDGHEFAVEEDEDEDVVGIGEDEVPVLSQGSTVSSSSMGSFSGSGGGYAGGNKRRFFEGEEEPSQNNASFGMGVSSTRRLAVPRRKKTEGKLAGLGLGTGVIGQENVNVSICGEDADFEDAEFLDYALVGEVEMGGV